MQDLVLQLLSTLLICTLFFIGHGLACRALYIEVNGYPPTGLQLIVCFTPILNLHLIRVLLFGEAKVYKVLCNFIFWYFVVSILLRIFLPETSTFTILFTSITALINLILVAFSYLLAGHCTSSLCSYFDGESSVVWSWLLPPFGAVLAHTLIKNSNDTEGTDFDTFNDYN